MNPEEVIKLLVDFFQARSYFDVAEMIADIKVDSTWKLVPTRLERMCFKEFVFFTPNDPEMLDLAHRQQEREGGNFQMENANGVSIPKSIHNSFLHNLGMHSSLRVSFSLLRSDLPDRSYGRHSRESHSVCNMKWIGLELILFFH
jgi:hypothetical protein